MPPDHLAHRGHLQSLAGFLQRSSTILNDWDRYTDRHTDDDGYPLDDDAYDRRASRRDADTYAAFADVRDGAPLLLATAASQLARLPSRTAPQHWAYQLGLLRQALDILDEVQQEWLVTLARLPEGAGPGTAAYDDALAGYHADTWSHLDDWQSYGHTLININTAAQQAPSPLAPAPAVSPACGPARHSR
ncbi:hypothetical protein ACFYVL_09425 [Streptomyces sp. NPDC004111]|uniref:hypothetical protein n=1 Tax=Streptomyces sp. NPDC004111 TaxID=3364690 RepID=UPI0036AA83A1